MKLGMFEFFGKNSNINDLRNLKITELSNTLKFKYMKFPIGFYGKKPIRCLVHEKAPKDLHRQ